MVMIRSPGEVRVFEIGDEMLHWSAQRRMQAVISRDFKSCRALSSSPLLRLCQVSRVIYRHVLWNDFINNRHDFISVVAGFGDGAKFEDFSHFDLVLRMSKAY
jgi:hypothetical protein